MHGFGFAECFGDFLGALARVAPCSSLGPGFHAEVFRFLRFWTSIGFWLREAFCGGSQGF